MRQTGTVKFFNHSRGFGFIMLRTMAAKTFSYISPPCRSRVFGSRRRRARLFETEPDRRGKGPQAINVQMGKYVSLYIQTLMSSVLNSGPAIACRPRSTKGLAAPACACLHGRLHGLDDAGERNRPGDFDYYVLVLGWSPASLIIEDATGTTINAKTVASAPSPCMGCGRNMSEAGRRIAALALAVRTAIRDRSDEGHHAGRRSCHP